MAVLNDATQTTESERGRSLTRAELGEFLGRGLVARLACLDANGWPYNVPIWFHWDGTRFWVIGSEASAWARYLLADPRVSLCIDDPVSQRRVMCRGTAQLWEGASADGGWLAIGRQMSARYLGERAAAYDRELANSPMLLFAITPARLVTWQGPSRHRRR